MGWTYYWLPATFRLIMATTIILDIGKQEEIGVEVFAQWLNFCYPKK